jgi:two-component system sensor kinase FixL
LQQVLLNLVLNGMDAMANTPEAGRKLAVQTARHGSTHVMVSVRDAGHGISIDKESRVFDLFFTTKKAGMGLGLSIARSIIEAHRGRIWWENNLDGGATFFFTVPVLPENS